MAMWPFSKKRRSQSKDPGPQPVRAASTPTPPPAPLPTPSSEPPTTALPDMPSTKQAVDAARKQRRTSWRSFTDSKKKRAMTPPGKENIPPPPSRGSVDEDITALPNARHLDTSPHLRPVDLSRAPPSIPYNFYQNTGSQTSMLYEEAKSIKSRPGTVRSKRSGLESSSSKRRPSTKRRKEDQLREEEIRAMSAPIPIPKRQGEGVLRKDSNKKPRSLVTRGSLVSLPPEESIHSSMSANVEQRGWEVGNLDVFNPRPAVRLSGAPQYIAQQSVLGTSYGTSYTIHEEPMREKDKRPVTRDGKKKKKRDIIGDRADDLGASELRMLMERDAQRRVERQKRQQEKLDRKLRSRGGREQVESVKNDVYSDDGLNAEISKEGTQKEATREFAPLVPVTTPRQEARRLLSDEDVARRLMTPPTAIHPALRDATTEPEQDYMGMGMGIAETRVSQSFDSERDLDHLPTAEELGVTNNGTYLRYPAEKDIPENPFEDAPSPPLKTEGELPASGPITPGAPTPGVHSGLGTPMEEPVLGTAQAVRLSQTPVPLQVRTSTQPSNPPYHYQPMSADYASSSEKRLPEIPKERRAGAWASFFRRGTTRKAGDPQPSQGSFSNASRESMRNQPLPSHLVDTMPLQQERRRSGTPVRTMSKFREDLPELPISPPDSRTQSPDAVTMAAAAALARRPQRTSRQFSQDGNSIRDLDQEGGTTGPISPGSHRRRLMSPSLASIGSEGSWLASGGSIKRQSGQSGLGRGIGSLQKRRPEFSSSYEELGGDNDVEYFQSMSSPSQNRDAISPGLLDASLDEASEYDTAPVSPNPTPGAGTPGAIMTVHESMRRKPTLVHRDARVKSREGLLTSLMTSGVTASPGHSSPATPIAARENLDSVRRDNPDSDDEEPDSPAPQLRNATSVNYGRGHARHVSAGSAILLDMPKRASTDLEKHFNPSPKSRPNSQPVISMQSAKE